MYAVLIVEDDKKISSQIEKAICSIGREVRVLKASEGASALEIAKTMAISVFVIDIGLPDCDGIELAKEIRKMYPYHPIIIESSRSDANYQMQIHDLIENLAFLSKPYSNEKLIMKVNHALDIAENIGSNQLRINQNGFSKLFDINDIIYIEKVKNRKRIVIHSFDQNRKCLMHEELMGLSLNAIMEMLKEERELFRCHKGFIINPKMIERLNYVNNTISMKYAPEEIPIGKTFRKSVGLIL